jgi:hypothetical protein
MDRYIQVMQILFKYDPAALSDICPSDEYSPETPAILAKYDKATSLQEFAKDIYEIFATYMDPSHIAPPSHLLYIAIATEIWHQIPKQIK